MNELGKHGMRVAGLVLGLPIVAAALFATPLRRPDGWLHPVGWALAVTGLSLALLGATWRTRWQRCAEFLAVAIVGQACALQLLNSPSSSVYQHYVPWSEIFTSPRGLFLLGIAGQTLISVAAARETWPSLRQFLSRHIRKGPVTILLIFLLFAGVKFTANIPQYGFELLLTLWISSVSALNLLLVTLAIPTDALEKGISVLKSKSMHHLFPWMVAGWVTLISGAIAWFVFEGVPHIPDSVSYLFQAKYFSVGRLYLPAPPDPDSFLVGQVVNDGTKWYAYGFPGWPAVLALGVLAGLPWVVNPLLGGLTVLLAHALLRRLYGHSMANTVVCLLAVSPWFLFMSASFMGHPLTIVWTLLALLAVEKEREDSRGLWATLAGVALGALFLTRPLEGVLVGAVVGLWALGVGGTRLTSRALTGLVAVGILVGSLAFPYSYALTGDAFYPPQLKWSDETWYPGADRLGFGPHIGNVDWPHLDPLPGHGPVDVIINSNSNSYMSNFELFGWSFGSLCFVALGVLLKGVRREDWLFCAIVIAIVAGHTFYWSSGGPDFGARYWYQAMVPLVVLTIRGVQTLQQRLIEQGAPGLTASRVGAFVFAASLIAFINVMPWRSLGKYHRYRGMSADVQKIARTHGFRRGLVFVRVRHKEDYPSAFVFNPPTLEAADTIYARDAGPTHREAVKKHFTDRPVWFVGGSPSDEVRLRVLAGPIPPDLEPKLGHTLSLSLFESP